MNHLQNTFGSLFRFDLKTFPLRAGGLLVALLAILSLASAALADSFSFSETFKDKVVCERDQGDVFCDVASIGRFRIAGSRTWKGVVDISAINADTAFHIAFGNLDFTAMLSDDPNYVVGKTSATFIIGEHFNDNDKEFVDGKIVVKWNAKRVSIGVSGKLGGQSELEPVLADLYTENDSGPFSDEALISADFADFFLADETPVAIRGNVSHRTVTRGEDQFDLTSVTVHGRPAQ